MSAHPQPQDSIGAGLVGLVPEDLKEAYWDIVETCLVRFHEMKESGAHSKIKSFRQKLTAAIPGPDTDLIYHSEPFYVACDIAGVHTPREQEKLLEASHVVYEAIKSRRGW